MSREPHTTVPADTLRALNEQLLDTPDDFHVHRKLEPFLERRRKAVEEGHGIDWAHAEALAFASLLARDTVAQPAAQPTQPVLRAPIDPTQGVNFRASVDRARVYVGEQITYEVGVFLDDETRHRLRRNPEFTPPEPRAMLAYDLPTPAGPSGVRVERGRRYEVHVFQRALFPITAGLAAIPPARLSYAIPLSNSFFAREERRTARADSLTVDVLPLPTAGRPQDFRGAVGRFDISVHVDSSAARVGDPLLVGIRVRGAGNIKLLPRPALALAWAQAVASGERVSLDSSRATVSGYKEFTWLVTPRREGDVVLPALRYPYFDPAAAGYGVAVSEPRALRVRQGALASADPGRWWPQSVVARSPSGTPQPLLPPDATARPTIGP